jgi:hypothetical protein
MPRSGLLRHRRAAACHNRSALKSLLLFLLSLSCASAWTQEADEGQERQEEPRQTTHRQFPALRVDKPPVVDGRLDDEIWRRMASTAFFTDVATGEAVEDDTTVWIGYDEVNIYVAVHARDRHPERIVARQTRRGGSMSGEDRIRFRINPFNSRRGEDESELNVNPLGTQSASIAGGRAAQQEWEGAWESAAQIVDDGWTVEMAIPWRIFTRPAGAGRRMNMGINFERYQARTDILSYWSNLGRQERRDLGGEWIGVILPEPERINPFSFIGYTFGGMENGRVLFEAGVDVRYQATPAVTGVLTLNPDFSNIEGDVTSIDFTYSERLPNETRPFFLEGGGFFRSGGGGSSVTPFTSVRIGEFDVGAKAFGRIGENTNIGVLNATDFGRRNDSVVNLRQQLNPYDYVNFMYVGRSEPELDNQLVFANGSVRRGDVSGSFYLGKTTDDLVGDGVAGGGSLTWARDRWTMSGSYLSVGPQFVPRNGFVNFRDQVGWSLFSRFDARYRSGPLRSLEWTASTSSFDRTNGDFFKDNLQSNLTVRAANDLTVFAGFSNGRFLDNHDRVSYAGLRFPARDRYRNFGVTYRSGRLGGFPYEAYDVRVSWRFWDRLSLFASTEVISRQTIRQQDILALGYDITRDTGIAGRLVRRDGNLNWYLSLRRSGYGGMEYFVILGDPRGSTWSDRLVFKVAMPF